MQVRKLPEENILEWPPWGTRNKADVKNKNLIGAIL